MIIDKIISAMQIRKNDRLSKNPIICPKHLKSAPDSFQVTEKQKYNPLDKYNQMIPYNGVFQLCDAEWAQSSDKLGSQYPWKIHLYAENASDYCRMLNAIGPYLDSTGVVWKTIFNTKRLEILKNSKQAGKAFTIYPRSARDFENIARDVDYIIRRNQLKTNGTTITGDNQLGKTGRIFYRYELKTGKLKETVFCLEKPLENDAYNNLYDENRGPGKYLANDMTFNDDPWYKYNPASSIKLFVHDIDGNKIDEIDNCVYQDGKYILKKDTPVSMKNIRYIILAGKYTIDILNPYMQQLMGIMKNQQYIMLGRGDDCHMKIGFNDSAVSRNHAKIYKVDDEFFIQDCSMNGTSVIR